MTEPDWLQFAVSRHDPIGVRQNKLFAFMDAFILWRSDVAEEQRLSLSEEQALADAAQPKTAIKRKRRTSTRKGESR